MTEIGHEKVPTPFGLQRDPVRVVAFSDGVIAIAVTLLVLEIRPPQDSRRLLHGLATLWPSYLAYGLTFMLIGQVWVNHHVMFDHIRRADRLVLFLNTVLLMDLAFMPFTALLIDSVDPASVAAIARRFQLALVWIAVGTALGVLVPALGVAVIASFIPYYWLPIAGEIAKVRHRHERRRTNSLAAR